MDKDAIISDIDDIFKKDDDYSFINLIKSNIGVFLTFISIVGAFLVFGAKLIDYLIATIQYNYWGIDNGFIIEDNSAYLKLGEYVFSILLVAAANVITKKYISLWELSNCQIFIINKLLSAQKKHLAENKKSINKMKKRLSHLLKLNEALKIDAGIDDNLKEINKDYEELNQSNKETKNVLKQQRKEIMRWKVLNIKYIIISIAVTLFASYILQISSGLYMGNIGYLKVLISTLVLSGIIMAGVLISCWLEIKLRFIIVTKPISRNDAILLDSQYIFRIVKLLQTKIDENRIINLKQYFTNESCKKALIYIVYIAFVTAIILPQMDIYFLKNNDTFYVIEESNQKYVMLANRGNKYIFSECEITDDNLIIDNNNIYITVDPIKMSKMKFSRVYKANEITN